jgi:hypothetical protein
MHFPSNLLGGPIGGPWRGIWTANAADIREKVKRDCAVFITGDLRDALH